MTYKRVTEEERRLINNWCQVGESLREMGRRLQRAASSISREIKRNKGGRGYRAKQAHEKAQARGRREGPRRFTPEVKEDVDLRLQEGWTPEIISQRARLEGRKTVCKETIYQYIYAEAKVGGALWNYLPRAKRKRWRRCPRQEGRGRGRIPNQRMIDQRPAEVEKRGSVGHWEGDLINGASATGNLVTLVERNTRYTLIERTSTKEAWEVTEGICKLFAGIAPEARLSLTLDNGKEFAHHEEMAKKTGMEVYFARPYHSWERGTNENTNGLIRRIYPKKSSFSEVGESELKKIDEFINDRPRKCLGWMTPREKMKTFLAGAS